MTRLTTNSIMKEKNKENTSTSNEFFSKIKIGIIGAGTLGKAMMTSWIHSGILTSDQIYASTGHEASLKKLKEECSWLMDNHLKLDNNWICHQVDLIFLCVKPDKVSGVLEKLFNGKIDFSNKMIVSIVAGVNIQEIQNKFRSHATSPKFIFRAIPNVASKIGQGISCISYRHFPTGSAHDQSAEESNIDLITCLFNVMGTVHFFDEKYLNAAIALGASSPAFVTVMIEAMTDGAVAAGLPRSTALAMSLQSMIGACKLIQNEDQHSKSSAHLSSQMKHPSDIRDSITTPGGCTMVGLLTLEKGSIRSTISESIRSTASFLNERDIINTSKE